MFLQSELPSSNPSSRERNLLVAYRVAEALGCSIETMMEAADTEAYPDQTAELVRLWFKIMSPAARDVLLTEGRALAATSRGKFG